MCNAMSLRHSRKEVSRLADTLGLALAGPGPEIAPRYRIGPRQWHPVFRVSSPDSLRMEPALWDLIPPGTGPGAKAEVGAGAGRPKYLLTNARADKLAHGWPWRLIPKQGRALVPCDGFYEPEKPARAKGAAPWSYYALKDGGPFLLAGLVSEAVIPQTGEVVASFAVITTEANALVQARHHDRMPVLLTPEAAKAWLFEDRLPERVLRPYPAEAMTAWRVSDAAKNFRKPDDAGMIVPVETLETFGTPETVETQLSLL
ncbi:SOS response-associated peptidase [Algihabitans albus]|uniref:SOS response-associated peptidase n=1 Tax=Algihabitans albus TaxID=2164067 RepID=UPI000E5CAF3B|nr:SOS response-associated peptidase [Algihabitans albus]